MTDQNVGPIFARPVVEQIINPDAPSEPLPVPAPESLEFEVDGEVAVPGEQINSGAGNGRIIFGTRGAGSVVPPTLTNIPMAQSVVPSQYVRTTPVFQYRLPIPGVNGMNGYYPIRRPLWDREALILGETTGIYFFQRPIGQTNNTNETKTYADTSFHQSSCLDMPYQFTLASIELQLAGLNVPAVEAVRRNSYVTVTNRVNRVIVRFPAYSLTGEYPIAVENGDASELHFNSGEFMSARLDLGANLSEAPFRAARIDATMIWHGVLWCPR